MESSSTDFAHEAARHLNAEIVRLQKRIEALERKPITQYRHRFRNQLITGAIILLLFFMIASNDSKIDKIENDMGNLVKDDQSFTIYVPDNNSENYS